MEDHLSASSADVDEVLVVLSLGAFESREVLIWVHSLFHVQFEPNNICMLEQF